LASSERASRFRHRTRELRAALLGPLLLGRYNAFGQYYRFAAADVASPAFRPQAISLVMAGGLVGGVVGPELSKITIDYAQPAFFASYVSLLAFGVLAMAIVSMLSVPTVQASASDEPARPLAVIAVQPRFFVAVLVAAIGYGVMNFLMTATPLAMRICGFPYAAAAGVITAHVIAMFAPSFVTGSLIKRLGVLQVMGIGVAAQFACVAVALSGQEVMNFWWALALLGVGGTSCISAGRRFSPRPTGPPRRRRRRG
jgi:hypothetical protein